MVIWMAGRKRLADKTRRDEVPLEFLVENLSKKKPTIVPGTAVFLTSDIEGAPTALLHSLKHYKVLHEHNVILTVVTSSAPRVSGRRESQDRCLQRPVLPGGGDVRLHGDAEHPEGAGAGAQAGLEVRHHVDLVLPQPPLAEAVAEGRACRSGWTGFSSRWRKNATDATEYFHIPTGRVVEIGTQVML